MNATATKADLHACACSGFKAIDASGTQVTTTKCAATTRRTFAPGHDARLKGFLIKAGRLGHLVRTPEGGADQTAMSVARRFGFAHMVLTGIQRTPAKAARKATPAPAKVTAKVGRWTYEGTVADGTFTYMDKKGVEQSTAKFTQI